MVAICLLASMALTSCGQKSPFPGYQPTGTGLYYKQIVKGDGPQVNKDEVIQVNLAYYINDSLLYATSTLPEPVYDLCHESVFQGDLYEGFSMMHVGDSMSFMIKADSVYTKYFRAPVIPSFVTPEAYTRWEVKIEKAMTQDEFQQQREAEMAMKQQQSKDDFAAYLAENGITAQPLESGLIYVRTKAGKGPKATAGKTVKVHYTGRLLDGTVFDSSEGGDPIEFVLGNHMVIAGWDEGIALMSKGEKGVLYIPSELAYGPRQMGMIPPFSNLIFDVELVEFK